jgi:ferrochelatase
VAALVAEGVAAAEGRARPYDLVYQSRSGAPHVPWLEPDIVDHLEALAAGGEAAVVVVPIGFVSDHLEVVYDLDTQAREAADRLGLPFARAATPGTDPEFVAMLRELVLERLADVPARALSPLGPWPDACVAGCCANPRGAVPVVAGVGE